MFNDVGEAGAKDCNSVNKDTKEDPSMHNLTRAAVTAISAAAVKAKFLADQEEDQIRKLATSLVEKQVISYWSVSYSVSLNTLGNFEPFTYGWVNLGYATFLMVEVVMIWNLAKRKWVKQVESLTSVFLMHAYI